MYYKLTGLTATVQARYDSLEVAYHGTPQGMNGFETSASGKINTPQLYFYHPDHLGSSSLITDNNGLLVQHLQYLPFGEVFIDERKGSWHTPFTFSAKEQDEETGLHYFSARYYDSRTGAWLSVDPLAEKYPGMSSYVYCANNPVKYVDPDGRQIILGGPTLNIGMGKVLAAVINYSDLQDAYTLGSAILSPITGNVPTRFEVTTDNQGIFNGVNFIPTSSDEIEAAKSGLLMPVVSGSAVNKAEQLLTKAEIGQEAHRQIQREIKAVDKGAEIEKTVKLKDRTIRKDVLKSDGTFVIIKPNTNSGQKSARLREKLMEINGYRTETFFYDPNNPAYRKGSPTYMGPKNKK